MAEWEQAAPATAAAALVHEEKGEWELVEGGVHGEDPPEWRFGFRVFVQERVPRLPKMTALIHG